MTEYTDAQLTLVIGDWFSVCGNCRGNADNQEITHEMKEMAGEGCGVTWRFVASDKGDSRVAALRPDLVYNEPGLDMLGSGDAMEAHMLRGMEVLGPVHLDSIDPTLD